MATWHTIAMYMYVHTWIMSRLGWCFFFFFWLFLITSFTVSLWGWWSVKPPEKTKRGRERERDDLKGAYYTQVGTQYSLVIGHGVWSQDYNWQFPAHLAWPWWLANVLLTLWQICPAGWFDLSLALLALENTRTSLVPRPSRVFPRRTLKNTGWPGYKATLAHHRWTFYAKINIFH